MGTEGDSHSLPLTPTHSHSLPLTPTHSHSLCVDLHSQNEHHSLPLRRPQARGPPHTHTTRVQEPAKHGLQSRRSTVLHRGGAGRAACLFVPAPPTHPADPSLPPLPRNRPQALPACVMHATPLPAYICHQLANQPQTQATNQH